MLRPLTASGRHLLTSGLYYRYAHRLVLAISGLLVAGSLLVGVLYDPIAVPQFILRHAAFSVALCLLPVMGGALSVISLFTGVSGWAQPPDEEDCCADREFLLVLDSLAWAAAVIALGLYIVLLAASPWLLQPGEIGVFLALATPYWMAATTLTTAVLPKAARIVYAAAVLAVLIALALLMDSPASNGYLTWVLYTLCFNLPILSGMSWLFARAEELDELQLESKEKEKLILEERTRAAVRRRTNEFVHDHVLSVLSAISSYPGSVALLQQAAQETQEVLLGNSAGEPLSTAEDLARVTREKFPSVSVRITQMARGHSLGVSAQAIYAALSEAITNSLDHSPTAAKPTPTTRVLFRVIGPSLEILIKDDGQGFDVEQALSSGRFGIAHGIHTRMEEAGGSAEIISTPGTGTLVTLQWPSVSESTQQEESSASRLKWRVGLGRSLETSQSRILGVVILCCYGVSILLMRNSFESLLPSFFVLILCAAVSFGLLTSTWPDGRLPSLWTWVSVILVVSGNWLVLASSAEISNVRTSTWTLAFGVLFSCALLVRKQTAAAWITIGALALTTSAWFELHGVPQMYSLALAFGEVLSLTFWAIVVGWSARAVYELTLAEKIASGTASERALQEQVRVQLLESLRGVSQRAGTLIEPVAEGAEISDQMQLEARLLEADLRDEIRASSFTRTPVVAASREARRRGVEVVLLDDSTGGPEPSVVPREFIDQAVAALQGAKGGRVVVRLQPAGGDFIGTIVSDEARIIV